MFIDLPISFIHLEKDWWEGYYLKAVSDLGWNKKLLLTHIASVFCEENEDFLLECCGIEAKARGLDPDSAEFFNLYSEWRRALPDYQSGKFPTFPVSPLATIIDPEATMLNRRAFANIRLSQLHSVYLRVLSCADRGTSTAVLMSRIAKQHFQKHGPKYLKQFEADAQHTIHPTISQ